MPFIEALWFIAPAYAANSFPVLMRGKVPLDGRRFFRGRRLLGDGKTLEGTIGGILFGIFIGLIQVFYQHLVPQEWGLRLIGMTAPMVVLLSVGALAGDIVGSFIKRQRGMERGEKAVPLDQLGFLVAALLFVAPVFIPNVVTLIILFIVTPGLHLVSNMFGYMVKIKNRPW